MEVLMRRISPLLLLSLCLSGCSGPDGGSGATGGPVGEGASPGTEPNLSILLNLDDLSRIDPQLIRITADDSVVANSMPLTVVRLAPGQHDIKIGLRDGSRTFLSVPVLVSDGRMASLVVFGASTAPDHLLFDDPAGPPTAGTTLRFVNIASDRQEVTASTFLGCDPAQVQLTTSTIAYGATFEIPFDASATCLRFSSDGHGLQLKGIDAAAAVYRVLHLASDNPVGY
jgi:hypothetical protein